MSPGHVLVSQPTTKKKKKTMRKKVALVWAYAHGYINRTSYFRNHVEIIVELCLQAQKDFTL